MKDKILARSIVPIIIIGAIIHSAVIINKSYDRTVSVKGLCEREIMADRAIYPITYKETGNDLPDLYKTVRAKNEIIMIFLKEMGIDTKIHFGDD